MSFSNPSVVELTVINQKNKDGNLLKNLLLLMTRSLLPTLSAKRDLKIKGNISPLPNRERIANHAPHIKGWHIPCLFFLMPSQKDILQ